MRGPTGIAGEGDSGTAGYGNTFTYTIRLYTKAVAISSRGYLQKQTNKQTNTVLADRLRAISHPEKRAAYAWLPLVRGGDASPKTRSCDMVLPLPKPGAPPARLRVGARSSARAAPERVGLDRVWVRPSSP